MVTPAFALSELSLSVALPVHFSRAPAGPEILVQCDGALGLDYLVAHPLQPRNVLRDARVWRRLNDRSGLCPSTGS